MVSSKIGISGPKDQGQGLEQGRCTLVEGHQFREYLSKLDIYKSMGPDGVYPWSAELAGWPHIVRPHLIVFDRLQQLGNLTDK